MRDGSGMNKPRQYGTSRHRVVETARFHQGARIVAGVDTAVLGVQISQWAG